MINVCEADYTTPHIKAMIVLFSHMTLICFLDFFLKNILYTNVFIVDVALIGLYIKINATSF